MAKTDPEFKVLEGNPDFGKLLAEFNRKKN
jgi:hypothetical protein